MKSMWVCTAIWTVGVFVVSIAMSADLYTPSINVVTVVDTWFKGFVVIAAFHIAYRLSHHFPSSQNEKEDTMLVYNNPGDEATDVSDTLGWAVNNQVVALVQVNRDSICARAILFGFHESLARAIASMNPQVREQILSTIARETREYAQTHDSCSQRHQSLVKQNVQEWVEELNERVIHHVPL